VTGLEVRIEPFGFDDQAIVRVVRAPDGLPAGGPAQLLNVTDYAGSPNVKTAGQDLFERLQANEEAAEALRQLVALPQDLANPVYLDIDEPNAMTLPWEQLCVDNTFLSLSWSWQVARLSNPIRPASKPYVTTPSIRLLAILSALHQPARAEWRQIKSSVENGIEIGLDITLRVTATEPGLREEIKGHIDEGNRHVRLLAPPATASDVPGLIRDHEPHLIHFFAHGSRREGSPVLTVAKTTDWDDQSRSHGSLNLKLEDVGRAAANSGSWLIVLNSCSSAAPANERVDGEDEVGSFAAELVSAGVPAAIGHRKAIESNDANRLARALYPEVLRLVRDCVSVPGRRELDFASVMHSVRQLLREAHGNGDAAAADNWSVPVLYLRPNPLAIEVVENEAEAEEVSGHIGHEDVVNETVDALEDLDLPPGLLEEIRGVVWDPG
jgi:hypothetical protein